MHLRYNLIADGDSESFLPVVGESAIGRDLREYYIGLSAARRLNPIASRAMRKPCTTTHSSSAT